jgi:hypothetical protein
MTTDFLGYMLDCIEDILSEERVNTLRIDGSTPIVVS